MEGPVRRTPEVSLGALFLRAAATLPERDPRAEVVAAALDHLQQGFDAHYAREDAAADATNEEVLLGDNEYARAVETIAHLDEPRFVEAASRMIRDGAGRISAGGSVTVEFWHPHLASLLDVISDEGLRRSGERLAEAARDPRVHGA